MLTHFNLESKTLSSDGVFLLQNQKRWIDEIHRFFMLWIFWRIHMLNSKRKPVMLYFLTYFYKNYCMNFCKIV